MDKRIKWLFFIAGGVFMLGLVAGVLLLSNGTAAALAAEAAEATPDATEEPDGVPAPLEHVQKGFPMPMPMSMPFWGNGGGPKGGGYMAGYEENLAEALGITVDELNNAKDEAFKATLEDAVADEHITQEQADQIQAYRALRGYIDPKALMAAALGISVEDMQAALDAGKSMKDLMEEAGLDGKTFLEKYQAAYEAAVQQAVSDGVITQAQADQVLSRPGKGMNVWPGGDRRGRGRPGHGEPEEGTEESSEG